MKKNILKENLEQGQTVIGPFLKITDPAIVEIAGYAGFDFVIIDTEHGPVTIERAQDLVRAAEAVGITPIIRVLRNEEETILKALDIGAHGVEVPQINTRAQSDRLRKAVRFNPEGERGVCCYVRSAEYSRINQTDELKKEYFEKENQETLVIAHIEGLEGIRNLDEIMEEDAIDVIFIGPYDLSQSLGIPGQVTDSRVEERMKSIIEKTREQGKAVGTFVDDVEAAYKWKDAGVQFIAYSVDVGIIYEAFQDVISRIKT